MLAGDNAIYGIIVYKPEFQPSILMARTASTMLALGTKAPDFQLPDVVSGQTISLETFASKKAMPKTPRPKLRRNSMQKNLSSGIVKNVKKSL